MNKTEQIAYEWLTKQGYKHISFSHRTTPDFVTETGEAFEVKKARNNVIFFGPLQAETIAQISNLQVLVFDDTKEPLAIIPGNELTNKPRLWQNYRLIYAHRVEISSHLGQKRRKLGLISDFIPDNALSLKEVVKRLKLGTVKVSELLMSHKLKGTFARGAWYIREEDLERFIRGER